MFHPHGVAAPALVAVSEERRVEMETQTPVDIEADAVPLSLSQRPLPQGPCGSFLVIWVVVLLVSAECLKCFFFFTVSMYFDAGALDVIAAAPPEACHPLRPLPSLPAPAFCQSLTWQNEKELQQEPQAAGIGA